MVSNLFDLSSSEKRDIRVIRVEKKINWAYRVSKGEEFCGSLGFGKREKILQKN
jgi:hypothetical protein